MQHSAENFAGINPYWSSHLASMGLDFGTPKGEGCFIEDKTGKKYLDCIAGFGTASLGHRNKNLTQRLKNFLETDFVNIFPLECPEVQITLAQKLMGLANHAFDKIFFATTGAEAVESAVKFALISTQRKRVITFENSFHGLNLYSSFLTGNRLWTEDMPWQPPEIITLPPDFDAIEATLCQRDVAAIVLEPIRGSSRAIAWSPKELDCIRELCDVYGTRLIFDDVYAGFCRSGDWFSYQTIGMSQSPDMVLISKGLTGGLIPFSIVLLKNRDFDPVFGKPGKAKIHGSTFSGNRLAVHCCLAVIEIMESLALPQSVRVVEQSLKAAIHNFSDDISIHGVGLALSIELEGEGNDAYKLYEFWRALLERNVLTLPTSHTPMALRISPPLIFGGTELNFLLENIEGGIQSVRAS
jgi:ornithine--oxo-acid transaminase